MLQAYEATPEPSVLLAFDDSEAVRLLAIILEGFGYVPLECREGEEVRDLLKRNMPSAALVYMGLREAESICAIVHEREDLPLLILVDDDVDNPQSACESFGALRWERVSAEPEAILGSLRALIGQD